MKCRECQNLDKDHLDMLGEPICTKGDMVIRLRRGQGRPDDCPLKDGEQDGHC